MRPHYCIKNSSAHLALRFNLISTTRTKRGAYIMGEKFHISDQTFSCRWKFILFLFPFVFLYRSSWNTQRSARVVDVVYS